MTTEPITPERVRELLDAATPGELHMDQRWGDAANFRAPHNVAPLLWLTPDIAKAYLDLANALRDVINVLGPGGTCGCHAEGCALDLEANEALQIACRALGEEPA